MSKAKKPPVDRAVATIRKETGTDALKVSVTNSLGQAMAKSPDWAAATDVQTAVKAWTANAAALGTDAQTIAGLRAQLNAAEAAQEGLRRDWQASRAQVISTVTVFCGGSADKVAGFNLDVVSHQRLGAMATPTGLSVNPGTGTGEVEASWSRGLARAGFLLQHATDPTNAATVSAVTAWTKTKFTLGGLPSNANVSFRVAAIDPSAATGQSPWSGWVGGNAR